MDLAIFVLLSLLVIVFFKKKFKSFIYFVGIYDIFLRIVTFFKIELTHGDIYNIINKYIPANIPTIFSNYSKDIIYTALLWLYVIIMIIFEFYIIKVFIKKR